MNKWIDTDHVTKYLNRADRIPHRKEGESVLLEHLPKTVNRVLDIGTGAGRLFSMVLAGHSHAEAIGLDFSPVMLDKHVCRNVLLMILIMQYLFAMRKGIA
jgi:ubiquinone/menaquinone biosynthesis C-methylase UbiE